MSGAEEKWIVVTDLDGTLLDDRYRWDEAEPAIRLLAQQGCPLVLNSSKTLAEMRELAEQLPTDAPLVAENGGLVAIPEGSPLAAYCDAAASEHGFLLRFPGLSREVILRAAHGLREARGYDFEGFADWPLETIVRHTGLSEAQALLAAERRATEPVLWHGGDGELEEFRSALAGHGVRVLRGGRFLHLMGTCDKAGGMRDVRALYAKLDPAASWSTLALGDSANDLEMLNAADAAAVIPNPHGGPLLQPTGDRVFTASLPAPAGWNEALNYFLTIQYQ